MTPTIDKASGDDQTPAMFGLVLHAVLGIAVLAIIIRANPTIFSAMRTGPQFSALEIVYYVAGIVSIPLCWYFNYRFVAQYQVGSSNPFWGPGSWVQFIQLGYTNPAARSASADYTIANLVLLPLFTIIDGRRRGIKLAWLYLAFVLFASFSFAWAFYLATVERQRRQQQQSASSQPMNAA